MLCSEIFKDHTMKNLWKINVWYTPVHRISTTAHDTIVIFSAQIELFKISKMTIKHEGKHAVLGNFQRPHYQKSMENQFLVYCGPEDINYGSWYHCHFFCVDRAVQDIQNDNKTWREICCARKFPRTTLSKIYGKSMFGILWSIRRRLLLMELVPFLRAKLVYGELENVLRLASKQVSLGRFHKFGGNLNALWKPTIPCHSLNVRCTEF